MLLTHATPILYTYKTFLTLTELLLYALPFYYKQW